MSIRRSEEGIIYLQKYFLNKVDGQSVGVRPESSLGFSLIFVEVKQEYSDSLISFNGEAEL